MAPSKKLGGESLLPHLFQGGTYKLFIWLSGLGRRGIAVRGCGGLDDLSGCERSGRGAPGDWLVEL